MFAAVADGGGIISITSVPLPTVGMGQALVRVAGSSVNPSDWEAPRAGVLGRDFAGTVVRSRCPLAVGVEVWGVALAGAWAEYLAVQCIFTSARPRSISAGDAGALPLVALTALQALTTAGAPWSTSPTLLVLGGSGGVGHIAIQIAKALGAGRVVATTSARNADFVTTLGADEVLDYTTTDWGTALSPDSFDVVLDAVGEDGTGDKAMRILRAGGYFLTLRVVDPPLAATSKAGVRQESLLLTQRGVRSLDALKNLVDTGKLSVTIDSTFALGDINAAIAHSEEGHVDGKIAISISLVA